MLGRLLLLDGLVGERVPVGHEFPDRGPEVLLLHRLVLGLLDDELLDHLGPEVERVLPGRDLGSRAGLQFLEHLLDLDVVLPSTSKTSAMTSSSLLPRKCFLNQEVAVERLDDSGDTP